MNYQRLVDLYNQASKHSNYQILAKPLRKHIPSHLLQVRSRFEQERMDYILKQVSFADATLADIGGNTGFFTFEFISRGGKSSVFIEGNQSQALFVSEAVNVLGWQNRVDVHPIYLNFSSDLSLINVDICMLLNVLHHVGDDYGRDIQTIESAKQHIIFSINRIAQHAKFLIFQMGFNWKGDIDFPIFKRGTKDEQIDFIKFGTKDFWHIKNIGVAEIVETGVEYSELNSKNIKRQDSLGEFLNRPLFILQSRHLS